MTRHDDVLAFGALGPATPVDGLARVLAAEVAASRVRSPYHKLTLLDRFGTRLTAIR